MFLAFISRRLIIFSPNYPLKFRLPEFSPGGYYSGKFHQNPCSVCEFSEPGGAGGRRAGLAFTFVSGSATPSSPRCSWPQSLLCRGLGKGRQDRASHSSRESPLSSPLLKPFN